jgi:hypothetical protein
MKQIMLGLMGALLCIAGYAGTAGAADRLVVIGDEDLYITSKTDASQLTSGVSNQAEDAVIIFEGEPFRWKGYGTPTSTVGAYVDASVHPGRVINQSVLQGGFAAILDEDSAATGASLYIIYRGRQ